MSDRAKLLLLIPHLGGGGAERVIELLARNLSPQKYDVHLGLLTQEGLSPLVSPPHVIVHALGARRVRCGVWRLLRLIWRLRPNLILSGIAHLNLLALLLRPLMPRGTRIVVRQNGLVGETLAGLDASGVVRWGKRMLYRSADGVICQSDAMGAEMRTFLREPRDSIAVLSNPIDTNAIRGAFEDTNCARDGPGTHLLAIGRLSQEKGFDLLLRAFAEAARRFPAADLTIAGVGSQKAELEDLRRSLGLSKQVKFAGYIDDPIACFCGASLFVLSSRNEGMPNALLEAASAGLPIVATPASAGLVELIKDKPGVWLAREASVEALAESLIEAFAAIRPGERFAHRWVDAFRLEKAIPAYEQMIDRALQTVNG